MGLFDKQNVAIASSLQASMPSVPKFSSFEGLSRAIAPYSIKGYETAAFTSEFAKSIRGDLDASPKYSSTFAEIREWVAASTFASAQLRGALDSASFSNDKVSEFQKSLELDSASKQVLADFRASLEQTRATYSSYLRGDAMPTLREYYRSGLGGKREYFARRRLARTPETPPEAEAPLSEKDPACGRPEGMGSTRSVTVGLDVLVVEPDPTGSLEFPCNIPVHVIGAAIEYSLDHKIPLGQLVAEGLAARVGVGTDDPTTPSRPQHLRLVRDDE